MRTPQERAADLLRGADDVVSRLAPHGACEVRASHVREMTAVFERDDFTVSVSNATAQFGIRAIVDGRLGFATTNTERSEALGAAADEALAMARVSSPSEHHHVAADVPETPYEELCDPAMLALTPEDVNGLLGHLVDEARRDERVAMDRAELTWRVRTDVIASSAGVRGSASRVGCGWQLMGMAREGGVVTSFDYDGSESTRREGLEAEIARTAGAFRDSVVGSLGARKARSYRGRVILHPSVALELLGGIVRANCNGLRHVDDATPWRGRVGELVASEMLSVVEDPRDATLAQWAPFDREGRPTVKHRLVDRGRLSFLGYDGFCAHRAGVAPTGNAVGGAQDLPATGFRNLQLLTHGDSVVSEASLYRMLGEGLVLKRFSGNEDADSGHFSGTAKNSWWVKDGQRAEAVHELMVSGNLFEVLQNVVAAGDTPHVIFGSGRAPYLLVDGVSVTSA